MAEVNIRQMAAMVGADDKLLKALIILLALRDDHLLDELRAVVMLMRREDNELAEGVSGTWEHLRHEMALISDVVDHEHAIAGEMH